MRGGSGLVLALVLLVLGVLLVSGILQFILKVIGWLLVVAGVVVLAMSLYGAVTRRRPRF